MCNVLSFVKAVIILIDPHGIVEWRRGYHARASNEVWHIDGPHKFVKWRLVTDEGIDGYSWMITLLL